MPTIAELLAKAGIQGAEQLAALKAYLNGNGTDPNGAETVATSFSSESNESGLTPSTGTPVSGGSTEGRGLGGGSESAGGSVSARGADSTPCLRGSPSGMAHVSWHPSVPGMSRSSAGAVPPHDVVVGPPSLLSFATEQCVGLSPEQKMDEATACYDLLCLAATNLDSFIVRLERPIMTGQGLKPCNFPFASILGSNNYNTVLHGGSKCNLPAEAADNSADGEWFLFLGDRVAITHTSGATVYQDPEAVMITWKEVVQKRYRIKGITMSDMESMDPTAKFQFEAPAAGGKIRPQPRIVLLPWSWVVFLLEAPRSPAAFWAYVTKETKHWTEEPHKTTRAFYLGWIQSLAAAQENRDEDDSRTHNNQTALPLSYYTIRLPNVPFTQWASTQLYEFLPYPVPPVPATPATSPAALPGDGLSLSNHVLNDRLVALMEWQDERDAAEERRRLEAMESRPKKLDDATLCNLLGWCGLSYEDRASLPAIWQTLAQCSTKPQKHMALKAMLQQLALRVGSFRFFENRRLLDNICDYALAPGLTADNMHHGLSTLAFILQSVEEAQQVADNYETFESATVQTTADWEKYIKKAAPSLPVGFFDFMQVLEMQEAFLEELFTAGCDAVRKLSSLRAALLRQGRLVMNNANLLGSIVPNVTWALIRDHHEFFNTFSTKDGLELNPPQIVQSGLGLVAAQLADLQVIRLGGMPPSLRAPFLPKQETEKGRTPGGADHAKKRKGSSLDGTPPKRQGEDTRPKQIVNKDVPPVIANDPDL